MEFIPSHRGITPTPDQLEELRINGEDGSTVSDEGGSFYLSVTPGTQITLSNAFSFYVVNQAASRNNNRFGILDAWISVQQIQ